MGATAETSDHAAAANPDHTPAAGLRETPATPGFRRSAWTPKQKIIRALWGTVGRALWLLVPPARSALIRVFGGAVGPGCSFHRSVAIAIPWNLEIGSGVRVGPSAILYSLGLITIGDRTALDRRAHLCAGTHDMTDPNFPLLCPPITVGKDCLIGIDAYVGPEVTLGDGCTVEARASVYKPFPAGTRLRGNPATPVETEDAGERGR